MSKKDNIDENPLNFYYPTVDDIYKETYKKLQKIIGWEEFKNRGDEVVQEYISKDGDRYISGINSYPGLTFSLFEHEEKRNSTKSVIVIRKIILYAFFIFSLFL